MAWSDEEIAKFEDIVSKLAAEAHLAKPGSDEGLIPIYSLVNEIEELPSDPMLDEAVEAIGDMIQPMLDDAIPFDAPTIEALKTLAVWCADAYLKIKNGEPLESFIASGESSESAELPPVDAVIPDDPEEYDLNALATEGSDEPTISFEEPTSDLVAEEEPISFEEAANDLRVETSALDPESIEHFGKLAQQYSAELLLAEKDNDEGMLPVYSLIKDFDTAFSDIHFIANAIQPVLDKMDQLLDNAQAYDDHAIALLTEFNIWLEEAHKEIGEGYEPRPFEPSQPAPTADAAPESDSTSEGSENDGLLAEFAEFDIVMDLNMEENEELLQEFHTEAVDHLGQIESAVLELEQDPGNRDAINSMFRSFHTIKGVAGFLNLIPVNRLAHEVESLMDLVRNDKLGVFTGIIDLVLESKDTIGGLIEQITTALNDGTLPSQVIPVSRLMARARWAMEGEEEYARITGGSVSKPATTSEPEPATAETTIQDTKNASQPAAAPANEPPQNASRKKAENASIRVNTWKLDNLMDMVGELVIVQSQLHECSKTQSNGNSVFQRNMSQLSRITKELQHTSMSLRMIPIKPTFQKMGRIVRDLSAKSGKIVKFDVSGEDTELDRNVVEEIGDPLVHMIRNALDHGLEPPEDRTAVGKPETGHVTLKAYHQGSNIVIELRDDGRGIDADRVFAKALANGIVREDEQISKEEIYKLIFAPGFSTAEKITDISGRGVGMDVVKKNIEKLRGKIEIDSELGKGSTFKILLPLTMAIVDGLVVKVGEDRFILPTTSVKVALRPDASNLAKIQGNEEILNIRGKVIPLFRLHNHFQIPKAVTDPKDATVVVVETAGKPCGLLVDDMVSKQEVVIKSLGSMMQGIPGVSGGAILGDGTIALILDPASLISVA